MLSSTRVLDMSSAPCPPRKKTCEMLGQGVQWIEMCIADLEDFAANIKATNLWPPGSSGAHLILMECTPADDLDETMTARLWIDVHMFCLCPGKERTAAQWKKLFTTANFKLIAVTETRSAMKVIEAAGI